jgi:RNA polymerase sigma-32 factor
LSTSLQRIGNADPELARYLALVRTQPRLSQSEEEQLARAYQDGDEEAGQRLVLANLHLVVRIAFRYHSRMGEVVDLIQEGNVGLLRALDKFDPSRGVPFSAYASYWIRAMVLRFLMENHHLASVANTRQGRRLFWELARERRRIEATGQAADPKRLAEALGVEEHEIVAVSRLSQRELSLADAGPDGGRSWDEILPDPGTPDPDQQLDQRRLVDAVRVHVEAFARSLDARDRRILEARIVADEPATLGVLADELGVSRERVRQLEVRIRSRLRELLTRSRLGEGLRNAPSELAETVL